MWNLPGLGIKPMSPASTGKKQVGQVVKRSGFLCCFLPMRVKAETSKAWPHSTDCPWPKLASSLLTFPIQLTFMNNTREKKNSHNFPPLILKRLVFSPFVWQTSFLILNQSIFPCPVRTIASWPAYRFLKRQIRCSDIPISLRIFHCLFWSTQ